MLRGYKYRIYPNKEQETLIQKTFGCCRFVYNQTLSVRQQKYKEENINMSKFDCNNYKNQVLKKKYEWLKEVDKFALDNSIINMDNAYQKFFKEHTGFPKFKSKKDNHKSYKTNITGKNIEVDYECDAIKLPKLKWVKAKIHRQFTGKIKSATISQVPSGKYFVSILVEEDIKQINKNENQVGIDLGISDLAILSNGMKFKNPRFIKQTEKKLAREQRKLSKMELHSKCYEKQRIKVARLHEHIANQRKDYLHKITSYLSKNYTLICLEDLSSGNIMKNHHLSKTIADVSWHEFNRQLEYKMNWYGGIISRIDKWYPSSQICHCCGHRDGKKPLHIRQWICPKCGSVLDRDINASINILKEGKRIMGME